MNNDCAVALGRKLERKRNRLRQIDPEQPGIILWRRRETDKDGTHGQEQERQQTIPNSGGRMSRPCAPPGKKRFNFNFCLIENLIRSCQR